MDGQTIAIIGLAMAWTGHIAAGVWWLGKQFTLTRTIVYTETKVIADKMTAHELADEKRFAGIERTLVTDKYQRQHGR